ncbi:hypothetical protein CDAR_6681, partial [Caerostris darwini]
MCERISKIGKYPVLSTASNWSRVDPKISTSIAIFTL